MMGCESSHWPLEPNISFEFVPIPRPHPSTTTYAHPCPPIAWHVPTHAIQIAPMYSKIVTLPIISHPCPPKTHGHGWAWAWAPNVGLCWHVVFLQEIEGWGFAYLIGHGGILHEWQWWITFWVCASQRFNQKHERWQNGECKVWESGFEQSCESLP